MLEKLIAISILLAVLVVLKYQNNIVRSYVTAYVFYFYTGWFFAKNTNLQQLGLYNINIISLLFGILSAWTILKAISIKYPKKSELLLKNDLRYNPLVLITLFIFFIIAVCSYAVLVFIHGVPILNISTRDEVSGFFTYLIGLLWILYPYLFVYLNKQNLTKATVLIILILLTMGYRTPLVVMILMFFILNIKYKKFIFSFRAKFLSFLLLLSVITIYPLLRFQDDPEAVVRLLANLDLPPELFIVAPFVLVFAEGASVVFGIIQIFPDIGAQWGMFTYSGFSTILPGEQLHSRTLLSFWLGRTNWQESTTTSTIIGQFYLEGGRIFTYIMSFVLGFFLVWGSYQFLNKKNIFKETPFLILFVFLTISIHTGLLDPIILYVLLIYLIMYIVDQIGIFIFYNKQNR